MALRENNAVLYPLFKVNFVILPVPGGSILIVIVVIFNCNWHCPDQNTNDWKNSQLSLICNVNQSMCR